MPISLENAGRRLMRDVGLIQLPTETSEHGATHQRIPHMIGSARDAIVIGVIRVRCVP